MYIEEEVGLYSVYIQQQPHLVYILMMIQNFWNQCLLKNFIDQIEHLDFVKMAEFQKVFFNFVPF